MPRFYISDGVRPGPRLPRVDHRTKVNAQSDILNEAQAITRGRKNFVTPDPYSFRMWRFVAASPIVDASVNPDVWIVNEMYAYDDLQTMTDIAHTATAIASSQWSIGQQPGEALDNDLSAASSWYSAAHPGGDVRGEWIGLDFGVGQSRRLRRVDLRSYPAASTGQWCVTAIDVQGSNDGVTWSNVRSVTGLPYGMAILQTITI